MILVGETSLRTILRAYHMSAIWRRVETGYHLSALDFEQTKKYINHQLKKTPAAVDPPCSPPTMSSPESRKSQRDAGVH